MPGCSEWRAVGRELQCPVSKPELHITWALCVRPAASVCTELKAGGSWAGLRNENRQEVLLRDRGERS